MIGSKATVRIKTEEALERLAQILQEALGTPPFWFDSDREPPHSIAAMTECLGFEIWLRAASEKKDGEYTMIIESTMDISDLATAQVFDTSEWLSKHIRIVAGLDCTPVPLQKEPNSEGSAAPERAAGPWLNKPVSGED